MLLVIDWVKTRDIQRLPLTSHVILPFHMSRTVGTLSPIPETNGFIFEPAPALSGEVFATYMPQLVSGGEDLSDQPRLPAASRAILEQLLAHAELSPEEAHELLESAAAPVAAVAQASQQVTASTSTNATANKESTQQQRVRPQTYAPTSPPADEAEQLTSGAFNLDVRRNGGNLTTPPLLRNGLELPFPFTACDLHFKGNLELGGLTLLPSKSKNQIVAPLIVPDGVKAVYTFDELAQGQVLDRTGNQHHGLVFDAFTGNASSLRVGPGRLSSGASATFDGKSVLALGDVFDIAPNDPNASTGFTISAWLYLPSDRVDVKSPNKGAHVFGTGQFSVGIMPSRQLVVHAAKHTFVSHAQVRPNTWTHIALVYDHHAYQSLSLFVNGVRDVRARRLGEGDAGQKTVYVGQFPRSHIRHSPYATAYYLDDLRIAVRPMSQAELGAEAFPALGAVESSFATLGCGRHSACTREQALRACSEGYHLCTRRELDAGALFVARVQGWISWTDEVWAGPEPGFGKGSSFLELETEMVASDMPTAEVDESDVYIPMHHKSYRVPSAVPLSKLTSEEESEAEASEMAESVPVQNPYSLLDAQDQNAAEAKPVAKKSTNQAKKVTKKSAAKAKTVAKPTPMPPPKTPIEQVKKRKNGPDTYTVTTARKQAARKVLPLPSSVASKPTVADAKSDEWATKVAICCADN